MTREEEGAVNADLYTRKAAGYETSLLTGIQREFNRQRDEVLANVATVQRTFTGQRTKDYIDSLLNWEQADVAMKAAVEPALLAVIIETGMDAMQQIGMQPSTYDPYSEAITAWYQQRTTKVAEDVTDETEKQLHATLTEGVNAGESSYQLQPRIEAVMGLASTLRADLIAQTEIARAQSYADIAAWDQSGIVTAKEWYTAQDERVCKFCGPMHGRVIGLEENFYSKGDVPTEAGTNRKGEEMPYVCNHVYDDVVGAPLHPRCRCTLLPVRVR
ncbi:SPP1 gp7 family putative phage head morphogenesis protein [Rathayibacter sp. PhB151]|uniref:phage minor head protein n=1 Tax=Rathayibacter sp. PhB151 TaxID=2485189 RepID=UPI0010630159|nr:phage minor head protein [Rathayibacter sp. PhB151]TDX78624.1 SPP1 gp7 family putative phage head morphogenesis protein [Rathayibacter sp. PhB151]